MYDSLASAARLQDKLGTELFKVLTSSAKFKKVKAFCEELRQSQLDRGPDKMVLAGRTFTVLSFLKEGEEYVACSTMTRRSRSMVKSSGLDQETAEYILEHRADIPSDFKDFIFLFPNWRRGRALACIGCSEGDEGQWNLSWPEIGGDRWGGDSDRIVSSESK